MYRFFKRLFDVVCALIGVIGTSPIWIISIVLTLASDWGPLFYFANRVGQDNKKFKMYKFRTMRQQTEEEEKKGWSKRGDTRVTKVGKFLRMTSLDELPELFNILCGDMSIVGPRPLLVKYIPLYSEEQRHRHDVRPGLTGYAQAHGRNAVSWEDKFAMDIWYTENLSFKLDLKIILGTVKAVLKRDGISSATSATMEEFAGTNQNAKVTWEAPV